jgi:hypothetical protein
MLKRGLLLIGAGLGLGAAGAHAKVPASEGAGSTRLELRGSGWRLIAPGRRPGELPEQGERLSAFGELLERRSGKKVGEFYSAYFSTLGPFGTSPFAAGGVEMHTFNLVDGTILGMGSHWGGTGTYAIVGGTGRYVGARGSYTALQRPLELGGDGVAEFVIDLVA